MKYIKTFESFSEIESVEEATVYGNVKITDALDSAEEAFWSSIASSFPDIKTDPTDDLKVTDFFNLRKAMSTAVNSWLKKNA
jgi:hypothetical protein